MAQNPYAAPSAVVDDVAPEGEFVLADRGVRLGAAIIDGLLVVPASYVFGMMQITKTWPDPGLAIGVGLYSMVLLAVNLTLLYRSSQSIGKKLVGIKIVRKDGSRASLARIFWLRGVVNAIPGFIPGIRYFYGLVDALFIFGEPRRCIHDYIADTIVIKA